MVFQVSNQERPAGQMDYTYLIPNLTLCERDGKSEQVKSRDEYKSRNLQHTFTEPSRNPFIQITHEKDDLIFFTWTANHWFARLITLRISHQPCLIRGMYGLVTRPTK